MDYIVSPEQGSDIRFLLRICGAKRIMRSELSKVAAKFEANKNGKPLLQQKNIFSPEFSGQFLCADAYRGIDLE